MQATPPAPPPLSDASSTVAAEAVALLNRHRTPPAGEPTSQSHAEEAEVAAVEEQAELVIPTRTAMRRTRAACPECKGSGWLRMAAPVGSPNFGRIIPCACKTRESEARRQRSLLDLSNLDAFSGLNFSNYDMNVNGVREAFSVAREFARHPDGWLLLMGGFGCGKTHLAAAIANETIARGIVTYFAVSPDLLDQLRAAYAPGSEMSFDARFEQIRTAAMLILDDFGTENATPWAREKLYQIFNYRYNQRMPTVVTTNVDLDLIEPRIRSRLCDVSLCRQIFIPADDYRLRPNEHRHKRG